MAMKRAVKNTCERMRRRCLHLGNSGFRWIQVSEKISNLKMLKNYVIINIQG